MDAFWGVVVPQFGPVLVALIGLLAGVAVKSGRRGRLDNLKAGAETLALLTEPKDQAAVKTYMAAQSAGLIRKSDSQFFYMGLLIVVTIVGAPLLRTYLHPEEPLEFGVISFTLGGLLLLGLVARFIAPDITKYRLARARKREERAEAAASLATPPSTST
uniref:hypothetical protein n=1 Tax=Cryobacterium sp. TaxID=1926290 RepID=UPI0015EEEF11|nr:hypothetical protein [Cryobacterium sp.]